MGGIYKLIPYYQRIFPKENVEHSSRFIIQKHPINHEWLLTEFGSTYLTPLIKNDGFENSFFESTIHSFSKNDENPLRDNIVAQSFEHVKADAKKYKTKFLELEEILILKNDETETLQNEWQSQKQNYKNKFENLRNTLKIN